MKHFLKFTKGFSEELFSIDFVPYKDSTKLTNQISAWVARTKPQYDYSSCTTCSQRFWAGADGIGQS